MVTRTTTASTKTRQTCLIGTLKMQDMKMRHRNAEVKILGSEIREKCMESRDVETAGA